MGNFEQVIELGNKGLKLIKDPQLIIYHANTLVVAGFFSKAREFLDILQDSELVDLNPGINVLGTVINCQSYGRKGTDMDSLAERFPSSGQSIIEANMILSELKITEEQILGMMDLAGEMMRRKNVGHL